MRKTKKILALALSAAMALSLLAGCGGDKPANNPGSANNSSSTGTPTGGGETGRVYWLNFKPELDETAQDLAKT